MNNINNKKKLSFNEAAAILDKTVADIFGDTEENAVVELTHHLIKDLQYALELRKKLRSYKNIKK